MVREVEVKGLVAAKKKMEQMAEDISGTPMADGMKQATLLVLRDAKENVPVDGGELKTSLTADIQVKADKTVQGVVGTNVAYAPYMELGAKPHWPPISAGSIAASETSLAKWARRHGLVPYLVARSIARKGLKPRKFLQNAFRKNRETIKKLIGGTVKGIIDTPTSDE